MKDLATFLPVRIGHDVWIGFGAIVLPGVTIGNGAVIGAGSVVTKDISAYSIAVGNPAQVIKPRLPPELAELLQMWQWWRMSPEELTDYEELFLLDTFQHADLIQRRLKEICQIRLVCNSSSKSSRVTDLSCEG